MLYNLAVNLTRFQKRAIILSIDVFLIALSYGLARLIILGPVATLSLAPEVMLTLAALTGVGALLTALQGLHRIKLNAYEIQGMLETGSVALGLILAAVFAGIVFDSLHAPIQVAVVTGMFFAILSVSTRLTMRAGLREIYRRGHPRVAIVIYGAGQTGRQLAAALATDPSVKPVAFVDDDRRLQSLTIGGLRVHPPSDIDDLIARHHVRRIVLAIPSARPVTQQAIAGQLRTTGFEVHVLPSFADLVANSDRGLVDTKPLDMNKLMDRDLMEEELPGVSETYRARHILVTGAGGSIGSELCRQLLSCRPKQITLMDHGELALFEIERELRDIAPDIPIKAVLGSVCDAALVAEVLQNNSIDIVLHAAAYKHVHMVEENALEGMRNNVLGTKVIAEAARQAGVERFILVSSDKAVRPSSVMGASKRLAELVVQDLATRSTKTRFSMVRFGNVLGSSGSVIPLFTRQIRHGGPVTLTHSDVTRYFMTIPEAVRLVLLAGSFARGG
ncbi:polysaccharide biosynthesis protein [Roseovarius bejariae]|uniref:polysaccharide biosynthesis protein n=1 Tax=Roseovarius bejariae TaxID=2576383 RepID=UPI001FE24606|nr:polysaccharide biosynthesis protein [Roseovarius bejariae]